MSVKKGDVLFIELGTSHRNRQGILIAEIQQNSNVTYRVYDYGREGKDGKKRDLHIERHWQSLAACRSSKAAASILISQTVITLPWIS